MDAMNESAVEANGAPSQNQKRQRARQACEPCRLRKRRCNGEMPCNMCQQFEYRCYFEKHQRKRSKLVEQNSQYPENFNGTEPPKEDQGGAEDLLKMRNMEANSGIAFTRLLGQRLDPTGPKMFTFGWNLGDAVYVAPAFTPITDFLNQDEMYSLAQLHFQNVHLIYGFLDKEWVLSQISERWAQPSLCKVPDHLFANLAAVGALFSDGSLRSDVPAIVDSAKRALEGNSMMKPPSLLDVQSWLLRIMYLRATDHPHAVHMAASVTMHLVETIGLHQEKTSSALHTSSEEEAVDVETRRRTFWVARMVNTWVSFETGRTRVMLRGITTRLPKPREGDFTTGMMDLYSLSCCLDPERPESKWEDFLRQLEEYEAKHDAIALARANLGLAGYRRIRLANPNPSSEIINRIIKIGLRGLEAARRMCETGLPWWHVGNVPFQAICVFLAMDVRESLSHIATAMRVLEEVVERFQTVAMREALKSARFLVRLSKKRKDEDAGVLGQSLRKFGQEENSQLDGVQAQDVGAPDYGERPAIIGDTSPNWSRAGSDDWSFAVSEFDWNFFLTADMPAFTSFAPDGTM